MNVFITSASRKVWLIKAFQDALKSLKLPGEVLAGDVDPYSASRFKADGFFQTVSSSAPRFIDQVSNYCVAKDVKLIVPTRDEELELFAENKKAFEMLGVYVMVSHKQVVRLCRDKYCFYRFLSENGFQTPKSYLPSEMLWRSMVFPICVKSRRGSGGDGFFVAADEREAVFFSNYVRNAFIQEYIQGAEFTADVYISRQKVVVSVVVRERIKIVAGESFKTRTVDAPDILEQTVKLVEVLGVEGHVTVQCMRRGKDIYFLEVNPRFGGAAALGFEAGAPTPEFLLRELIGCPVERRIDSFEKGLVMLRYTADFFLKG